MGRINVLDKHTAELIAAGEVVERPSSVIKELLENSIDAGASAITVEIKNGGTTFMRVTDNGCGIMRDDVKNAFLRHATSKVATEHDLDSISTLGFRGEALASVSAVARVELITCADNESVGTSYKIYGGEEVGFEEIGCAVGTTIIVRDLFYNVPARQKFLKKDVAEGNAVSLVMDRIALSHPEISFTFIRDSKQTLKTSGDGKLKSAVYSVFGREFSNSLIEVDYELSGIRVEGFISLPESARPNRNMQTFFVNNRYVRSRTAGAAVDEASKGSVMVGKFLSCVLNISMPFSAVDVNVHPAKIEVRFINERPLFDAVYHAVKSALLKGDKRKEALLGASSTHRSDPFEQFDLRARGTSDTSKAQAVSVAKPACRPLSAEKVKPIYERSVKVADSKEAFNYLKSLDMIKTSQGDASVDITFEHKPEESEKSQTENAAPLDLKFDTETAQNLAVEADKPDESERVSEIKADDKKSDDNKSDDNKADDKKSDDLRLIKNDETDFKYIGEAFRTYIIIEIDKQLILIDKHALHERMIYEQLKSQTEVYKQLLLAPVSVVLSKSVYSETLDNLDMFSQCGFEVEDFGAGTLLVRAVPQYLPSEEIEDTIIEMAGYIAENKRDIRTEKMDWIFHNIACRAAVKAGNHSTEPELLELVRQMLSRDDLRYCPHGRPVSITLKRSEIEKQFGRA